MGVSDLFNKYIKFYGQYAGDTFDILRPDYSNSDNTPVTVITGTKLRCDPSGPQFSEPKLGTIEWYEIFCDRGIIQSGDIIRKTVDDGMTPPVTIAHFTPLKACVGFRTSRIGKITNSKDQTVYSPVYFDFIEESYPGGSINRKLQDSLDIPSTRIVIYNREQTFRLGMQLIETDSTITITRDGVPQQAQRKWLIESIDHSGNVMILAVSNNLKR